MPRSQRAHRHLLNFESILRGDRLDALGRFPYIYAAEGGAAPIKTALPPASSIAFFAAFENLWA